MKRSQQASLDDGDRRGEERTGLVCAFSKHRQTSKNNNCKTSTQEQVLRFQQLRISFHLMQCWQSKQTEISPELRRTWLSGCSTWRHRQHTFSTTTIQLAHDIQTLTTDPNNNVLDDSLSTRPHSQPQTDKSVCKVTKGGQTPHKPPNAQIHGLHSLSRKILRSNTVTLFPQNSFELLLLPTYVYNNTLRTMHCFQSTKLFSYHHRTLPNQYTRHYSCTYTYTQTQYKVLLRRV